MAEKFVSDLPGENVGVLSGPLSRIDAGPADAPDAQAVT
jgi:hypothetical protein